LDQLHGAQSYERNTAIVETTLGDQHGASIRIVDFCPRFRRRGRIFRPAMLVRLIEPLAGRPRVRIRLSPMCGYGGHRVQRLPGSHHISYIGGAQRVRVTTDTSVSALLEGLTITVDRPITMLLGPDETVGDPVEALARQWAGLTREYWHDWVRTLAVPFDWQQAVIRAAITLKLCTFEDTGAVLAALTTSIPESAGTPRTWDYRYCWLRDAFFVIQALNRLGTTRTMEGFLRFIDDLAANADGDCLRPLYRLSGREPLTESIAPALSGYRGMGPVRVGNQAAEQIQNDVYGSLVLAVTQLFFDERLATHGVDSLFNRLERYGEQAASLFNAADAGPWELRGSMRPHTYSALMCWAACDRLQRIAARMGLPDSTRRWCDEAAAIKAAVLARIWDPGRQCLSSRLDRPGILDASLLLMPELGFLAPSDPRFLVTLQAIERELMVDGHVMRYRDADDFGPPANAFNMCTFWYVNALALTGQTGRAREVFEQLLGCRNHVGLLSEHINPHTGELWGNFPQTYSMVGIINSAVRLSRPWDQMV
jgi:GH15 family glucan-1,4-alpha-glucosidase